MTNSMILSEINANAEWCFDLDMREEGDGFYKDGLAWKALGEKYKTEGWTPEVAGEVADRGSDILWLLNKRLEAELQTLGDYIECGEYHMVDRQEADIEKVEQAIKTVKELEDKILQ